MRDGVTCTCGVGRRRLGHLDRRLRRAGLGVLCLDARAGRRIALGERQVRRLGGRGPRRGRGGGRRGSHGADRLRSRGRRLPPRRRPAGNEITRASGVRSITGTVSRRRSNTTRETGLGAGLNWATRTRSTTPPSTARLERGLRLITPSRSMTKRPGLRQGEGRVRKLAVARRCGPPRRRPRPGPRSRRAAWPSTPDGGGATVGWSGVPDPEDPADDAAEAGAAAGVAAGARRAVSSPSGSKASSAARLRRHRHAAGCAASLPSAVIECSTSWRVAMTSRVIGRLPSSLFCTASEETSPSRGRGPSAAHRAGVGQLDDHLAFGIAEAGPHQRSARFQVDEDLRRTFPEVQRADLGGRGSRRRLGFGRRSGSRRATPRRRGPAWRRCSRSPPPPSGSPPKRPKAASRRSVFS